MAENKINQNDDQLKEEQLDDVNGGFFRNPGTGTYPRESPEARRMPPVRK